MPPPIDLAGNKYGRLTVLAKDTVRQPSGKVYWFCECECGKIGSYSGRDLRSGNTKSCGCFKNDLLVQRNKNGSSHNLTHTPTYTSWVSMKQRCTNAKLETYQYYGGRGILVCQRWIDSFENFLSDMGVRPENTTLDRIDPNGNYEPGNCRWATDEEQGNNKRTSKTIEYLGRFQTPIQWAREFGIHPKVLLYRIKNGWEIGEALTMEVKHGNGWVRGVRK